MSSVNAVFQGVPKTMLRDHYRCHPKIIDFCNKKFYGGKLLVMTEDKGNDNPLIVYKTVPGNHARGTYNQRQIDVIEHEVIEQVGLNTTQSIGVISPYRKQVEHIRNAVISDFAEADTVHKFQGREKDVVVLTTVSNSTNNFVADPHLVNVAVSCAVKTLIVVVSDKIGREQGNLGDLIRYIKYNNGEVVLSKIHSVFDRLYQSYISQYFATSKAKKHSNAYPSERLMNQVIQSVLNEEEYTFLAHSLHVNLSYIVKDN